MYVCHEVCVFLIHIFVPFPFLETIDQGGGGVPCSVLPFKIHGSCQVSLFDREMVCGTQLTLRNIRNKTHL